MLGALGMLYTAVMMGIRFFDGSYAIGGRFYNMLPAGGAPVFGTKGANPIRFLVCCPISLESAVELGYLTHAMRREVFTIIQCLT